MCLILVGLFFAYRLYQKNLITLGDYYRLRFGRTIEVLCSAIIIFSYLGWVAAQITALGLVFNLLTQGTISVTGGMVLGTAIVLVYTLYGGMWSVALTDFADDRDRPGAACHCVVCRRSGRRRGQGHRLCRSRRQVPFLSARWRAQGVDLLFAAAITMMLGPIPSRMCFSASCRPTVPGTARTGPVIGGVLYLLFAFIPMFVVASAVLIMPETAQALLRDDPRRCCPRW